MLLRLVIGLALLVAVVALIRHLRRLGHTRARAPAVTAKTLRCAHCDVYFPGTEAVHRDGRAYCSAAHAEAAAQRG